MIREHSDVDFPVIKRIKIQLDEEADRLVFIAETVCHGTQKLLLTRRILILLLHRFELLLIKANKAIAMAPQHKNEIFKMELISAAESAKHPPPDTSKITHNDRQANQAYLITKITTQIKDKMIIIAFLGKTEGDVASNLHSSSAISALKLNRFDAYNLFGMICKKMDDADWNIQALPDWLERDEAIRSLRRTIN